MSKIGRNKKVCENYRLSGRREDNKRIKQKRHEERMEKFSERRELGLTYEYKSNPFPKGSREFSREKERRANKNVSRKTPIQTFTSIMRKLDNELAAKSSKQKEKYSKSKKVVSA